MVSLLLLNSFLSKSFTFNRLKILSCSQALCAFELPHFHITGKSSRDVSLFVLDIFFYFAQSQQGIESSLAKRRGKMSRSDSMCERKT